jgi:xanthine dehydrogenase accessory factor
MSKDIYEEIVDVRSRGNRAAMATIIARKGATPRKDSAKMLVYEDGHQLGSIGGGAIEAEVRQTAQAIIESGKPQLLTFDLKSVDSEESALVCGGSMEVYVEPILPDPTLFIFGSGHVAKAVAEVAALTGFRVAIVDDRAKYANSERFPNADSFHVDAWESVMGKIQLNENSYLLIATRSHQSDLLCLRFALSSTARYIGVLGSLKKTKILFEILVKEGRDSSDLDRVCVPVGIDIGAETPEEIAVSIIAEMIAARKNRDIRRMKDAVRKAMNPS